MNEIIRRLIMMIGIVSIGTILIFFNTSVYITITAALAFGVIMAMGLGLLKKEDFSRLRNLRIPAIRNTESKKESKKQDSKKDTKKDTKTVKSGTILSRFHKKEPKKTKTEEPEKPGKSRLSAGLNAALGSFNATVSKARDKKHSEKIDSLLNTAIDEPLSSSSDTGTGQTEPVIPDGQDDSFDGMGLFDEEDFESLESLEIEGEDLSFDLDMQSPGESSADQKQDSAGFNLDDEINSILLAENAFDEDDDFSSESSASPLSSEVRHKEEDTPDIGSEEGLFNSKEFFVQGIEDGLDEESFINLPDGLTEKPKKATLTDSLDELNNITDFENSNPGNDAFSDFDAINLDELEPDDFSLETDEIIIEEEEDINETDIFPDDYIPSQENTSPKIGGSKNSGDNNSLLEDSGFNSPEITETISFSGKNEYDDILSVLKSDIKATKKLPQASLVRDMKDVHVTAKDLAEDLEMVLHSMGGKSRKKYDVDDRGEE